MNHNHFIIIALSLLLATNIQAQTCNQYIKATTPDNEFTDNGDGTVTHAKTGLMWAKCSQGQSGINCATGSAATMTWNAALNAAENSSLAGYTDWRLPNKNELASLREMRCYTPAINVTFFPNTISDWFWTASPYADNSSSSWIVHFSYDFVFGSYRSNSYAVRLVRSGQLLFSFSLNVTKAGNGAGSITSNPAGINCGTDCSENYTSGTAITLTATPAAGSSFAGFSGDADCNDGSVTMNAAKNCTATFNLNTYNLALTKQGTGTGTVTSTPAGINCGSDCNENYLSGTVVNLTALPTSGSNFGGFGGAADCNDGQITMDTGKNCTATFNLQPSNGSCGSDNGGSFSTAPTMFLCSNGSASAVTGTGPWHWTCAGTNGGSTANCSANQDLTPAQTLVNLNIGALACQPPFLAQAANLRWHEHYLINPNLPTSTTTWVVCNIPFETQKLAETFNIGGFGNITVPGTNALCFASVVDIRNQHIPEGDFLDNPGQTMIFNKIMHTQNPANTLWSALLPITQTEVKNTMMPPLWTPLDPTNSKGPRFWSISIACQLKPGQALNAIRLWNQP